MWWGAVLVVATACGRYGFVDRNGPPGGDAAATGDVALGDSIAGDSATGDAAAGDAAIDAFVSCAWHAPVLVANVNSNEEDWEPAISPDGLTLVFNRQTPTGPPHLYMAHRTQITGVFSNPVNVLTSSGVEGSPAWSPDGKLLYFASDRGTTMTMRLYTAGFDTGSVTFGPAFLVGSLGVDMVGPTVSATDLELFYNDTSMMPAMRWATRPDAGANWTDKGVIAELTSGTGDGWPSLAPDGLTIYFESSRGSANAFIYAATRPAIGAAWTNIARVTELDDGIEDGDPDISADGLTIYFASDRTGGLGQNDLWVATRACF